LHFVRASVSSSLTKVPARPPERGCQARQRTVPPKRRTFNEAGVACAADKSFVAFEARGGRGRGSFLRVIRRRPSWSPLDRPLSPASGRLTLAA
jgi:hypothetical protein